MSLSETQQVYELLTEIDKLLADIELKIQSIEKDAPRAIASATTYFRLLSKINHIMMHLGLPKEIDGAIAELQRVIMFARLAHITLMALYTASGPLGWAMAGLSVAATGLSGYSIYESMRGV